jgi:endoglucanase
VWAWTRQHLQRPDHLLAWRWGDGAVVDATPAAGSWQVLLAGPWAAAERAINPSYVAVGLMSRLYDATGDQRWQPVAATSGGCSTTSPPPPRPWCRTGRLPPPTAAG